jgi:ABC-type transport system involved in multi-copper enzyme maturation permease subunit
MRKLLRSKRVIGIMAIAVLASYALTSTVLSSPEPSSGDDFFRYAVILSPLLLIVAAALVGSDLLLVEFHEKTGFSLFPNPVSRISIWFGKFLAAELIMIIILAIFFGLFTIIAEVNKHHISPSLIFGGFPITFMVATMMMSLAFLVSSIFKGPIGATITVLFALLVSPVADGIIASQMVTPWFTPFSSVNNAFLNILFGPEDRDENQVFFPFGLQRNMPLGVNVAVIAAYTVGGAIASILLFNRRDM